MHLPSSDRNKFLKSLSTMKCQLLKTRPIHDFLLRVSPIITWVMSGEDQGDGGDDAGHQVTPFPRYTATVLGVFQDHVQ